MSREATDWAWQQRVKPSTAHHVLLYLAQAHNGETGRCDPAESTIAENTGMNVKTVHRGLSRLAELGVITLVKRHGETTQYDLNLHQNRGRLETTETTRKKAANLPQNRGTSKATCPKSGVPQNRGRGSTKIGVGGTPKLGGEPGSNQERTKKHKPEHLELAEWIWAHIQKATDSKKTPNLDAWADDIRKLNEIDQRDLRLIEEVFLWAHRDDFWSSNILSAKKLREKFDTLFAKSRGSSHATGQQNSVQPQHTRRLTPAERTRARREQLRHQQRASQPGSSDVGALAADGGNVRPPVGIPAGGGAQ